MKLTQKVLSDIITLLPKGLVYIESGDLQITSATGTTIHIGDSWHIMKNGMIKAVHCDNVVLSIIDDYLLGKGIDSNESEKAWREIQRMLCHKYFVTSHNLSARNFEL